MTELHFALLGAAVVVLLLVFGWSKWQERRQVRQLRERLGGPAHDPLVVPLQAGPAAAAGRIEPRLGDLPGGDGVQAGAPGMEQPHPRPQLPGWTEDPMLDCVLELRCTHAVDGVAVIDATGALLRLDCALPVHVVAWDARSVRGREQQFHRQRLVIIVGGADLLLLGHAEGWGDEPMIGGGKMNQEHPSLSQAIEAGRQLRERLATVVKDRLNLTDEQMRRLAEVNQRYDGVRRGLVAPGDRRAPGIARRVGEAVSR